MTDFRELCAELVHLNEVEVDDWTRKWADAIKRTKAALEAQPEPPSLKEQALAALQEAAHMADDIPPQGICSDQIDTIRRALEQLPN